MSLHIPAAVEDPDLSVANAARAYGDDGWFVVPVARGTKHPGSLLGQGWHQQSACDTATIAAWWEKWPDAGVALHVGRSGAVALDVDDPSRTPDVLDHALLTSDTPYQRTNTQIVGKGHYLFTMPATPVGNSTGSLGIGWGDVRGHNGIIMAAPSIHPHKADGGEYWWVRTGPLERLPEGIADALPAAPTHTAPSAEPGDVASFLDTHTAATRPGALDALVTMFTDRVADGDSRHVRMSSTLLGAMREARAGHYPARLAEQRLRDAFLTATTTTSAGTTRTPDEAHAEFDALLAWAIAQANTTPTPNIDDHPTKTTTPRKPTQPAHTQPPTTPSMPPAHNIDDQTPGQSWALANNHHYIGPNRKPPIKPTIWPRTDNHTAFYPHRVNALIGRSETGKTWLALAAAQTTLNTGGRVLYLDAEDNPETAIERLHALGVPDTQVIDQFGYIGPDERLTPVAREHLQQALDSFAPDLIIVDGINAIMRLSGLSSNDNDDCSDFYFDFLKPLTVIATVIILDHVKKDGQGRGAIGAQAKRAMVNGCSLLASVYEDKQPRVGGYGIVQLSVDKDRHGQVRRHAPRGIFGYAHFNSTKEQIVIEVSTTPKMPNQQALPLGSTPQSSTVARTTQEERQSAALKLIAEAGKTGVTVHDVGQLQPLKGTSPKTVKRTLDALVAEGYATHEQEKVPGKHIRRARYRCARTPPDEPEPPESFIGTKVRVHIDKKDVQMDKPSKHRDTHRDRRRIMQTRHIFFTRNQLHRDTHRDKGACP